MVRKEIPAWKEKFGSIDELLRKNVETLVDTNIFRNSDSPDDWYLYVFAGKVRYSSVEVDVVQSSIDYAIQWRRILEQDYIATVPGVTQEFTRGYALMLKKQQQFEEQAGGYRRRSRDRRPSRNVKKARAYPEEKAVVQSFVDTLRTVRDAFEAIEIDTTSEQFQRIFENIRYLTSTKRIKQNNRRHLTDQDIAERELFTDEQLVAAGIYNSYANNRPSNIVSNDHDVFSILRYSFGDIVSTTSASSKIILDSLRENPITVYERLDSGAMMPVTSTQQLFETDTRLNA